MDANKKFLYFNADSNATNGTEVSATTVPVSTFCGMEVTSTGNFSMLFKESVETDTLDVAMSRTNNSDPRVIMERIVNEINFSKDSLLVVGDNSTSQFIDENLSGLTLSFAGHTFIKLVNHLAVHQGNAEDPGDGFDTGSYSVSTGSVGMINGEVITTLFIEFNGLTCPGTGNQAIGIGASTSPAYITQITTQKNGIVYRGEMICVEVGTGSNISNVIDLVANTSDNIDPGEDATAGTSSVLIDKDGSYNLGEMRTFDSSTITTDSGGDTILNPAGTIPDGGMQGRYLYLSVGSSSQSGGAYTAGKYIIRLYGAPTENLTDIS